MVMRSVVLECVTGLVIGVLLVSAAGRLLASKLFGVSAFDVTVLSSAIVGLVLSALVAGYLPARRAAGIDPMQALRSE
jgi:ABC-type antimicrobial peptide transport system permease subunit